MKKLLFIALVLGSFYSQAQILKPAKWNFSAAKQEAKAGETIDIYFNADIDAGWHLYSTDNTLDPGPMPAEFTFRQHDGYLLVGKVRPVGAKKKYDEIFEGNVSYFDKKAQFVQTVKILKNNPIIEGVVEFQTCTEKDGRCVPGKESFKITGIKVTEGSTPSATSTAPEKKNSQLSPQPENPIPNQTQPESPQPENPETTLNTEKTNVSLNKTTENIASEPEAQISNTSPNPAEGSLWGFFLAAFLSGLAALFTPCVFPVIPMTISYFTKQSYGLAKALLYGLSIIGIYTIIGFLVSRINGPAFANFISTHWIPNLIFFITFFVFGLSFLGLFEITLPSSFVNSIDKKADKGGLLGIFFMAFTLVLVSFSCTGPIVGTILVESAGGKVIKPIIGMLGYSLAFALPFTFFAVFPDFLKTLPKSGGWLNTVKVVLGFLELALALKFLSIIDQVYHFRLLDREVYLAMWIVIFGLIGFYLLGKIRTEHDSPVEKLGVGRILLSIATLSFVVYMIPGMWGAPLKALSGYLPPETTQDFYLNNEGGSVASKQSLGKVRHGDLFKLPHGLQGFFDYNEAVSYAKKVNKPIFIDFTGHGCVNCRKMEESVWVAPEVKKRLENDYVLVALYVDDKTELPENEWYQSAYDQDTKKSIGDQNGDLQITKFNNNAQPYYCLVDTNGKLLQEPVAFDTNTDNFVKFLDAGLAKFKAK